MLVRLNFAIILTKRGNIQRAQELFQQLREQWDGLGNEAKHAVGWSYLVTKRVVAVIHRLVMVITDIVGSVYTGSIRQPSSVTGQAGCG